MALRLLHTSDWHLGHSLHDQPRDEEHRAFLAWLLDTLAAEEADALVVAGDVFDVPHPPAAAQRQLFAFLAEARRRLPRLGIVLVGGNHDSPSRLDAPEPVLSELRVQVVGGLTRRADRSLDLDRALLPLTDRRGEVAAWLCAVPYLSPSQLDVVAGDAAPVAAAVGRVYAAIVEAARARRRPGQALVATGHAYLVGSALGESERPIQVGNQQALPVDVFPHDLAYVALGHLHRAQPVERPSVRYSGSPLPLSMTETTYEHQVLVVDLEGEAFVGARPVRIPRTVELLRVPPDGPRPLAEVLELVAALEPRRADTPEWRRPFLEVRYSLSGPDPQARARLEAAAAGKEARLVSVPAPHTEGSGEALGDVVQAERGLDELQPEEVLQRLHASRFGGPCSPALLAAFHELLEQTRRGER